MEMDIMEKYESTYYAVHISAKQYIWCDEIVKKLFLDRFLKDETDHQHILGFVLLDRDLFFVTEIKESKVPGESTGSMEEYEMKKKITDRMMELTGDAKQKISEDSLELQSKILQDQIQLQKELISMHRIPLKLGYVRNLRDYWWSSFQTYLGCYTWNGLETEQLFQTEEERGKFVFQHRRRL